jgi:D-alanyl-D-alanine carboxypeptidase/D-alanyl-D-alanine-endopeptidase (penicillin-binding protein 4)
MAIRTFLSILLVLTFLAQHRAAEAQAPILQEKLQAIIKSAPTSRIGFVVVDSSTGEKVFEHNGGVPYSPASVMKVVTSGAALRRLEPDYRFSTTFLGNGQLPGVLKRLVIQGEGDPSLTIESAWLLARQLKKMGVKGVESLVLDSSAFEGQHLRVGQRAYETGASPLSFNFNSVAIDVCPTAPGREAVVSVDPWESGITLTGRIMTVAGAKQDLSVDEAPSKDGHIRYSVSGKAGAQSGCSTYYRSVSDPLRYFATTFVGAARIAEGHTRLSIVFFTVTTSENLLATPFLSRA